MQYALISRVRYVQENRKMRFLDVYDGWNEGRLTQAGRMIILDTNVLSALMQQTPDPEVVA